ncbi:MAG TPA: hypothetical protein VHZ73_13970 [Vicinamibacterales bacterium]|nr:hypothetical protein [Vicinamibacterales bacterium]
MPAQTAWHAPSSHSSDDAQPASSVQGTPMGPGTETPSRPPASSTTSAPPLPAPSVRTTVPPHAVMSVNAKNKTRATMDWFMKDGAAELIATIAMNGRARPK